MKAKHALAWRTHSREILQGIGARIGQDFHTLRSSQVDILLIYADVQKYRKPKNANGSRGRYFYDYLQRRAQWEASND